MGAWVTRYLRKMDMPARLLPFLCAQREIENACECLGDLFLLSGHKHSAHPEQALDLAQSYFHKAIGTFHRYLTTCSSSVERCLSIRPTSIRDAEMAAQGLSRLLSGLLEAEDRPNNLTPHVVQVIRTFLVNGYPDAISSERLVEELLLESDSSVLSRA